MAVACAMFALACSEGYSDGRKPMTAPAGASAWTQVTVPGVDLFVATDAKPPYRAHGIARVDGKERRGADAWAATRTRTKDPSALATLAMMFLDDSTAGRTPWVSGGGSAPPEEQALAKPPAVSGDTLVYWRPHVQLANLVRCTVTMSTGAIKCELGSDVVAASRAANPDAARADLASSDVNIRIRGIRALASNKDAAVRSKLIELALNAVDYRERQAAVESLAKIGGDGVVIVLSRILLFDQYAEVREAAAVALGDLHDPAARDALTKAESGDSNARVQALAAAALKKL